MTDLAGNIAVGLGVRRINELISPSISITVLNVSTFFCKSKALRTGAPLIVGDLFQGLDGTTGG